MPPLTPPTHYGFTLRCTTCRATLLELNQGLPPADMAVALSRAHDAAHHSINSDEAYARLAAAIIRFEIGHDTP